MQVVKSRAGGAVLRGGIILMMCCGLVSDVRAEGWPVFRGNPGLMGVAACNLPAKPDLLWTFKTGGAVKSSAVIGGGKVFIGSNDGFVHALEFGTGREVWSFKADSPIQAPPLLANHSIFAGSVEGIFYALDAADGHLLWKYATDGKILASANAVPASAGPPHILVGSYDFKLYCFNAANAYSITNTNVVPVWTFETGNYINGSSAVANGQAIFGGCDALVHVLDVTTGTKIKEIDAGAYIAASAALAGGRAYFGHYDNEFLCVDINEGKVVWRYKDLEFPYMAAAAVTDDRVLFGGHDKTLHCVDRADGKSLWKFRTGGKVESSPVVAGGKVVFGSDDGLVYMLSLADGKQLWTYEIGQAVVSSPAVADEKIVIGSDDGNVYCFGQKS